MKSFFKIIIFMLVISNLVLANTKHINYIMKVNKNLNKEQAESLYKTFKKYTDENKVDIEIALAVASVESGFRETAKSKAGAYGIMQIMPITSEHYKGDYKKLDENIEIGVKHLKDSIANFGKTDNAIASYNAGIGKIKTTNYKNIPETRYYVAKVKQELSELKYSIKIDKARELENIKEVVKKKAEKIGIKLFDLGEEEIKTINENTENDELEENEEGTQDVEEVREEKKGLGFKLGGLSLLPNDD